MIKINLETIKNNALYKKRKIYQKINIISAHKYESKIHTEGLIYAVNAVADTWSFQILINIYGAISLQKSW